MNSLKQLLADFICYAIIIFYFIILPPLFATHIFLSYHIESIILKIILWLVWFVFFEFVAILFYAVKTNEDKKR